MQGAGERTHLAPCTVHPAPSVLNVAVTGNAAAGKSTVVKWFRDWGATVIDAAQLVRDVEAPGSPILAAIARRFGAVGWLRQERAPA